MRYTAYQLEETKTDEREVLLNHMDEIHTTEMGADRIRRNLKINTADTVEYCKSRILDRSCKIYKRGKNWYCEVDNLKITINARSYTIITAHIMKGASL